jgi:hypothetical protein
MKKLFVITLSLFAAAAAFADDPTVVVDHAVYDKTRAQVQKELFDARADGSIKAFSATYNFADMKADKTRAEVAADALASQPMAAALQGEDSGSFALSRMQSHDARPLYAATRKPE